MASRFALACLAACGLCLAPGAEGQAPQAASPQAASPQAAPPQAAPPKVEASAYTVPRTSFGHPSFEGIWTHNFLIIMEASPQAPMLVAPEAAAKAMSDTVASIISKQLDSALDPEVPELMKAVDGLPVVRGERRTRSVVEPADGKLPYTPDARKESQRGQATAFDNHEERPNWERCITSLGLPPVTGVGTTSANPRQIIQTPGYVIVHTEYGDEARIIPFAATHKPKALHSPIGDSIARWEGDTLVIETIGLPQKDRFRVFSNLIVTENSKVIERFTRLSDKELLYQYTVEDPAIYSAPWLAEYSLYRTSQRMFEHACHEGNYSLPNILKGARMRAARAPARPPG